MKTTLNIDDRLLKKAKAKAALERTSVTRLIEEGLSLRLRKARPSQRRGAPATLPVYDGRGGLADGIDPSSNRALYDAADR